MERMYGAGSAEAYDEYLEGIFGDIGRALSSAASDVGRVVQKAAPVVANVGLGALKGAAAGSAAGLPGIIAGAAVGGAGAGLSSWQPSCNLRPLPRRQPATVLKKGGVAKSRCTDDQAPFVRVTRIRSRTDRVSVNRLVGTRTYHELID
jgi:hypothetical protein